MEARKPTYDQLFALCAQLAEALKTIRFCWAGHAEECSYVKSKYRFGCDCDWPKVSNECDAALTAYRALSPDPQWQKVPEGFVVMPETITADHIMRASKLMSARVRRKLDSSTDAKNAYSAFVRARGEG